MKEKLTFAQLCKYVETLTGENQHTEARQVIAKHYGLTKYEKLFEKIDEIHALVGYMNYSLLDFRNECSRDLLKSVKRVETETNFKRLQSAL